jgi:hypothetical protein
MSNKHKLQVSLAMLLAALASSAALAASASAVTSLGGQQWLVNGEEVTSALKTETTIELLLEDTKAAGIKAAALCSMIQVGSVKSTGEGETIEILNLSKVAISSTPLSGSGLSCTNEENCESPKVWAVHLPWPTAALSVEVGGKELLMFVTEKSSGGNPGWEIECTVLGVKASDTCEDENFEAEATNVTGGVEVTYSKTQAEEVTLPTATCSLSGERTGIFEGKGTIVAEAGTLSVAAQSEDPVIIPSENPVNFGTIKAGATVEDEVTFKNERGGVWTPGRAAIRFRSEPFSIVANTNTCNVNIAVGGTCLIRLQFSPTVPKVGYVGTLWFGGLTLPLEGRAL